MNSNSEKGKGKGKCKERSVDVYSTEDGRLERYYIDGWFCEERISPDHPPSLYGEHFGIGFRKVPTTTPIYPPKPECNVSDEEIEEGARQQTIGIAKAALEYYNNKHDTDYKLVDPVGSNSTIDGGMWFHCNFTAKSESSEDPSPKLFFAEQMKAGPGQFPITACRILDGSSTTGCGICHNLLQHPKGRFRKGLYSSAYRALRPRKRSRT